MIRRLFRFAVSGFCLLSLIACAGTAWAWRRSYRVYDRVEYRTAEGRYTVHSTAGRLVLIGPPPGPTD